MPRQVVAKQWSVVLCDSLEKVFPDQEPRRLNDEIPVVVFPGERGSFQVAFRPPAGADAIALRGVRLEFSSVAGIDVTVNAVGLVPVEVPAFEDADEHYLRTTPGLFPDLLMPADTNEVQAVPGQWRAAWIEIHVAKDASAADTPLGVRVFTGADSAPIAAFTVPVTVAARPLPELAIVNTQWFHCDSLADYYGYEVFSEAHWYAIDNFMQSARGISVNTILTPVWTPPLDTAVGGKRTATQLVGIRVDHDGEYEFDFTSLRRWIALCRKHNMSTLEIGHFFTQWGARYTPAIYVETDAGEEQRFGWHVAAMDPLYRAFLEALVPALLAVLDEEWGLDNVIFHISDEPTAEQLDDYKRSRSVVVDLLEGCTIIDAISDFELYESGAVPVPVVATDHAEKFIRAGVPLWLYYCVAQNKDVANRFIAQPSSRNRVIGTHLFLSGALGFLHWGFNFYSAFHSTRGIDPFRDTCAGNGFIGGDSFLVYPGDGGQPLNSIRYMVFGEAMNDYRAMQLLAELRGDEAVRRIVDSDDGITLSVYSYDADHYRRVLAELADAIAQS